MPIFGKDAWQQEAQLPIKSEGWFLEGHPAKVVARVAYANPERIELRHEVFGG